MKAQFKYALLSGFQPRATVFAVIFVINLVFIILGSLGWLPFAAKITAVSLGGTAIAVMMVVNIIGDVAIIRRMFAPPEAYLYALIPAPRQHILLASVITMMVMDIITMAVVIVAEIWLSLLIAGDSFWQVVWDIGIADASVVLSVIVGTFCLIAGYLLIMMVILFGVTARKSIFYQKSGGGWLTALLILAVIYAISLIPVILAPFGTVSRFGLFWSIELNNVGSILYYLLYLIEAAALFVFTSKLMERKMNI
ncbi:MAG: hypothetical protein FWF85_01110 [Clostridiales bacterium]|nr:hypothetical protein [Clostridiales bacterium]